MRGFSQSLGPGPLASTRGEFPLDHKRRHDPNLDRETIGSPLQPCRQLREHGKDMVTCKERMHSRSREGVMQGTRSQTHVLEAICLPL